MPWYIFGIIDNRFKYGFLQNTSLGLANSNGADVIDYHTINLSYKMAMTMVFACDSNNGKSHLFSNAIGSIWHGYTGELIPIDRREFLLKQYIKHGQQGTLQK